MPRAQKGVLIEWWVHWDAGAIRTDKKTSDPTVKQLILKLDEQANHSIVLEDLDQYRILVVEPQVPYLRQQLDILLEENTYAAGNDLQPFMAGTRLTIDT